MSPDPSPLERRALARLKAGDPAGAEAELMAALEAAPRADRPRLWEAIGEARLTQGFALEAARALEQAGAADPRLTLRRARMLVQAGKFPAALAALGKLPAAARQGFDFWALKADGLRQSGRWNEAVSMKPGSVIVDMAVSQGGNCPLSKADEIVDVNGVKVAGFSNLPARLPADSSSLYAKNLLAFLPLITGEGGKLNLDTDDEIVKAMLLTRNGATVSERLK